LAKAKKMVNLSIEETSGVDHPAHLHEGWLVMKSANETDVQRVLDDSLNKEDSKMEQTVEEQLQKALEALAKAEARIEELESMQKSALENEQEVAVETPEDLLKSAPESVVKMVEDLRKAKEEAEAKAEEAEATLQKQREEAEDAEAIEKARAWSHLNLDAEVVGKAIRRLTSVDAELAKSIEDVLSSVNAQAESSDIFAEIGKSVNLTNDDAYGRMTAMAKSLVDAGKATSIEAGIASVAGSNPELYSQYLAEKGA
jgi:membrane protein involved in colicin uptake